jgi:hypothetical protein
MNMQQHISELRPDHQEWEKFINDYASRQARCTTFVPTEVFIRQEIEDITGKIMNQKLFALVVGPFQVTPFLHAVCATMVFEGLTKGRNLTVGQVIEAARAQAEVTNRRTMQWGVGVSTNEQFDPVCFPWIKTGITFAYYIQYLYRKMQDHTLTPARFMVVNNGDGNIINIGSNNPIDAKISINKIGYPNDNGNGAQQHSPGANPPGKLPNDELQ